MKKIMISSLLIFSLVGCQSNTSSEFDTSKLVKIEMSDVTEEQQKNIPITYEANSLEDGLKALPFEVKLPNSLPIKNTEFQPPVINDMKHDGEELMKEFQAASQDGKESILISVFNIEVNLNDEGTREVDINNEIKGYYGNNSLSFNKGNVSYTISFLNEELTEEERLIELTKIAEQMI